MTPAETVSDVRNLIGVLHRAHLDNSTMQHLARRREQGISIMPLAVCSLAERNVHVR